MKSRIGNRTRIAITIFASIAIVVCTFLLINLNGIIFAWSLRTQKEYYQTSPPTPYSTCEKFISAENGVRIEARANYDQWQLGGDHLFYSTNDGGQTWTKFMQFRYDDPYKPICDNIKSFDDKFFWVWTGWIAGFTHDGGITWTTWEPQQTWSNWTCCNYRLIVDIEFDGLQSGSMTLSPSLSNNEMSALLRTKDGGSTWK